MKKLKLFLLGLIITLLSIGSFSNAQFFNEEELTNSSLLSYKFDLSDVSNVSVKQIGGRTCMQVKYSTGENCNVSSCSFVHFGFSCDFSFSSNSLPSDSTYVRFGQLDSNAKYIITTKSSKMPISVLTPAIDGLKGTVIELIPYVIYIGIGMLLVTIGFYAIRRLVNWLGGKVKSNFNSKRK